MARKRTRRVKLASDSLHDTEWQLQEYARVMGEKKAAEQERAYRVSRGLCVCKRRTLKNHGVFRTIHERDCVKWRAWMEEYENMPRRWTASDDEATL